MSLASRRPNAPTSMQLPTASPQAVSPVLNRPILTLQREQGSTSSVDTLTRRTVGRFSTPSVLSLGSLASALPAYNDLQETENPDVITTSCEVPDSSVVDSPVPMLSPDEDQTPGRHTRRRIGGRSKSRRRSFTSFFRLAQKQEVSTTVQALYSPGIQVAQPYYLPSREPRNIRTGFARTIPSAWSADGEEAELAIDPMYWFATIFRLNALLAEGSVRQAQALLSQDPRLCDKVSLVKRSEAASLEALPLMSNETPLKAESRSIRSRSVSPEVIRAASLAGVAMPHPLQADGFRFPTLPGSVEPESERLSVYYDPSGARQGSLGSRASSVLSASEAFEMARRGSAVSTCSDMSARSSRSASSRLRQMRDKLGNLAHLGREEYVLLFE